MKALAPEYCAITITCTSHLQVNQRIILFSIVYDTSTSATNAMVYRSLFRQPTVKSFAIEPISDFSLANKIFKDKRLRASGSSAQAGRCLLYASSVTCPSSWTASDALANEANRDGFQACPSTNKTTKDVFSHH